MGKEKLEYKIDWNTIDNILDFDVEYDGESDTFLMQSKKPRPAVAVDYEGEIWFRVDPKSGEILGVEIEGFRKVFLKRHPELLRSETTYVRPVADFIRLEKCPA